MANITEIQGTSDEIIQDKIKKAADYVSGVVLCEDVAFNLPGIGGLPGPYVKWFL